MFKLPLIFASFVFTVIMIVVYIAGDYSINFDYFNAALRGQPQGEKDLITDYGVHGKNNYFLRVTTRGIVEFQKEIGEERDSRSFQIETADLNTIKEKIESYEIFKLYTLDRTYCFVTYNATMNFDFGWISKGVKYSNCKDDPTEVKNFRQFLYSFLGLNLEGSQRN